MKRLIIALLLALPLISSAKGVLDAKYLKGGVPEENGVIVFQKSFSVPGKTDSQICEVLSNYVQKDMIGNAIPGLRTRITSDGKEDNNIVAKVEEYMVFHRKAFSLDRTRFRYQFSASVNQGKVKLIITQISYYYNEDMEGNNGVTYKGEEWITDKEAINKGGNKLYPRSGKFRIKTIDRAEEIFEGAMDALEERSSTNPEKRKRNGIVEE